jgi:hypothetical protein
MSWEHNKEPIDYLRQRVKYYKKKRSLVINLINKPEMIEKYGAELKHLVFRRCLQIDSFIDMFKKAVNDLETIEKNENEANQN